jgi:hypothetical protein
VRRAPEGWYQIKYLPAVQRVLLLTAHKKIREVGDDLLAQQPQSGYTDLPSSTIYQLRPSLKNVGLVSLKVPIWDTAGRYRHASTRYTVINDIRPLPGLSHSFRQ